MQTRRGQLHARSAPQVWELCDDLRVARIALCDGLDAGRYSSSKGSTTCTACGVGYYASSPGASLCLSCSAGTFSSEEGSVQCSNCSAGSYSISGSTVCSLCAAGTASRLSTLGAEEHIHEQANSRTSVARIVARPVRREPFPARKVQPHARGVSQASGVRRYCACYEAFDLHTGYYSEGGTIACTACMAGKYATLGASVSLRRVSSGYLNVCNRHRVLRAPWDLTEALLDSPPVRRARRARMQTRVECSRAARARYHLNRTSTRTQRPRAPPLAHRFQRGCTGSTRRQCAHAVSATQPSRARAFAPLAPPARMGRRK
jgi:hypothetical protein